MNSKISNISFPQHNNLFVPDLSLHMELDLSHDVRFVHGFWLRLLIFRTYFVDFFLLQPIFCLIPQF